MSDDTPARPTRRHFLQSAGAVAGTPLVALSGRHAGAAPAPADAPQTPAAAAPATRVALRVNGEQHELLIEPRVTLLDALRDRLGLTGTKKGCDRGQCGACTVIVDGRRINSCLTLAMAHAGDDIVTIEGLGQPGRLHPMQAAFIRHDAFQCGYCTPGQICSAVALLRESAREPLTENDIRERMSGNICRCGAYPNIVKAVQEVASMLPGRPGAPSLPGGIPR